MTEFSERFGPWAVVTGAAMGVGLAFVEEIHGRGVGVVMVDRDPTVHDVAAELSGETRAVVADVTDPAWLDTLTSEVGDLEIGLAVANAGISFVGNFLDMSAAQRQAHLDVNCKGVVDLAAWALPAMVARGRGGFVATSSGSALAGTAGVGLYSATKAFVVNLIEAVGWEIRESGVVTQAVVAPSMDTPAFRANGADHSRMMAPPVDPRTVVSRALDDLPEGGRWLADEGLEFAATVPRADRVDMMSAATTAMYPQVFES
ncbi:MAG: SDR family NAD(P)-dependent oxidoreductase [Acidimicrobiales bacterium]